jgi:cephalosporin-C deacetylase-like acetyl esterase
MRSLLLLLIALITCLPASRAADPQRISVLDAKADGGAPGKLLKTYLLDELRVHYAARRKEVDAITTPAQFAARQKRIRETLRQINGPLPKDRGDLAAKVVGKIDRDGYVIEKVIYQSRPQHHVTANLYLPKNITKPVPGVLVPCGHSRNGKAAEVYQKICISLAKRGMAALIYDPIGQGERHQLLGEKGTPIVQGTSEHNLVGIGAWLVGLGTANYRIWDGMRSLDYLSSRPEVDAKRLGCTGNSGGGTMTSFLMAFDDRIAVAAPSCYLTTFERLFDTIGPQDAEQNFPGQIALGLDHADFIAARAPKPTLMCVASQDFFDLEGAWTTFRESKKTYGILGHPERMSIIEYNDKHGFSKPRREAAMRFFRRWLQGIDDNPAEGELTTSTDAELQCTANGEVLASFAATVSVFELTRDRAGNMASQRSRIWQQPKETLQKVRKLTGTRTVRRVQADDRGLVSSAANPLGKSGSVRKLVLRRSKQDVPVPALLCSPATSGKKPRPAVIYVASMGKASGFGESGAITKAIKSGKIVLAIDVRGFGETAGSGGGSYGGMPRESYHAAMLSLHLNRPLLGQRTEDILTAVSYLAAREDVDESRIELIGVGHCGPVALHAAAFDKRILQVTVVQSIPSWLAVLGTPTAGSQLENVVPFALETYDLPDLVRAIAPRKVVIESPVDPHGKSLLRDR